MEIFVEIHKGEDGRLAGTIRADNETEVRSFSGNLEFLALVEIFYLAEGTTSALGDETGPPMRPQKGESND
jgi:hypothetical protein